MNQETKNFEAERKILDSGTRREFESGAVRDIQEGKGRCDLMPLGELGRYFELLPLRDTVTKDVLFNELDMAQILKDIDLFIISRNDTCIYDAIRIFINATYGADGNALLNLSMHYEEGAKKYADRNWEKGMPLHCFIDSGVRHLLKYFDEWRDEPHERAFLWNMFGLLWTFHNKPELDDLPRYGEEGKGV